MLLTQTLYPVNSDRTELTEMVWKRSVVILVIAGCASTVLGCGASSETASPSGEQSKRATDQPIAIPASGAAILTSLTKAANIKSAGHPSSFEAMESDGVQLAMPKNWLTIDPLDTDAMNTNSEALSAQAGAEVAQGDNRILFARNAMNRLGQTDATARVSVRSSGAGTQAQFREALESESTDAIDAELRAAGEATGRVMKQLPFVKHYELVDAGIRRNNTLVCMWNKTEIDNGRGPMIVDAWVCPLGSRTLKLTTSYRKEKAMLFAATIDYIWNTLSVTDNK